MTTNDFNTPPGAGNTGAVLDSTNLLDMSEVSEEQKDEVLSGELTTDVVDKQIDASKLLTDKRCQRCGWNTEFDNVIEVTDEDKNNFVASVLSGGRFSRTYDRYGGRMKITMRSRTVSETNAIMKALEYAKQEDNIDNMPELMTRTMHYQMVVGLESISRGDDNETYTELTPEQLEKLGETSDKMTTDWNETMYSTVQNVSQHFDQVVQNLMFRAHDPDFWKAVVTPA